MKLLSNYETPLWTLIGVMIGFALSHLYNLIVQRKQYSARIQETIERIKKSMQQVCRGKDQGPYKEKRTGRE